MISAVAGVFIAGAVTVASAQSGRAHAAPVRVASGLQQERPPRASAPFSELIVHGARYFTPDDIAAFLHLRRDEPLPAPPPELAADLQRRYVAAGYWFARVDARFDEDSGQLTLDADEGRLDAIQFAGVPPTLARAFTREFALQPGDIFRSAEADRALEVLLRPTEGAVLPGGQPGGAAAERKRRTRSTPFEKLDLDGKRVLVVHLATRRSDLNFSGGTNGREDWFSPVDGFSPSVGFNETIFDLAGANHTFINGYVSYKFGREHVGYALGFERPFFLNPRLYVGAEIHDQSASDDLWRVSANEQSLATSGFKKSFHDYYERRGYQLNAAVRLARGHEVLAAWRDERQEALVNTTNFSLFDRDGTYRSNQLAAPGRLHALVFGYIWDSRGLGAESRAERYERHQLADLFGTWGGEQPGWRFEWTSEVAAPALGGDFDYRRHLLNVRRYNRFSPRQTLNLRAVAGVGDGGLPPQRAFAIGGVGSVPGYDFKTDTGSRMVLFSAEYKYRVARDVRPMLLYDAGRVYRPLGTSGAGWIQALGPGIEIGKDFRLEAYWPLERGRPAVVLVRLRPTF